MMRQLFHIIHIFPAPNKIFRGNFLPKFPLSSLYLISTLLIGGMLAVLLLPSMKPVQNTASRLVAPIAPLHPLNETKNSHEVMGFVPFWNFSKLHNIDFNTLTTLAYFGVPVLGDGTLDRTDQGYITFKSRGATTLFKKAHANGTKVVLTLTQMQNAPILALLDNPEAQAKAIAEATEEVQKRGIDGINLDFEYSGDPGPIYRQKYNQFAKNLTLEMHRKNPNSFVTVSVYAASVKDPKIYDIAALGQVTDGVFMMAYDYANLSADQAMPTAPLYGYKEGKYWYDVSSAVESFLTQMPAEKLILGVPWYGYNYLVYQPEVKAATRPSYSWRGQPVVQTNAAAASITPDASGVSDFTSGWDDVGKVGWKAYFSPATATWRMIFVEDKTSLGLKYDFAKAHNLKGVGIWALGYEDDSGDLWEGLKEKFGQKLADTSLINRIITTASEDI